MDELQRIAAHKLPDETKHLQRIVAHEPLNTELALSVAKRVRKHSNLAVRLLAELRDNELQSEEDTST